MKKLRILYSITGFIRNTSLLTAIMSGLIFLNNQNMKAALLIIITLVVFVVAFISREMIVEEIHTICEEAKDKEVYYIE